MMLVLGTPGIPVGSTWFWEPTVLLAGPEAVGVVTTSVLGELSDHLGAVSTLSECQVHRAEELGCPGSK